jgi:hypothetical protein
VGWQRTAAGTPLGDTVLAQRGIVLLRFRVAFGDRLFEGFEALLHLLFRQALGLGTELHPRQLQQKMAQPVILGE